MTWPPHTDLGEPKPPISQMGTVRLADLAEGRRLALIRPGTRVRSPSPTEEESLRGKSESHVPALTPETEQQPQERGPVSARWDWPGRQSSEASRGSARCPFHSPAPSTTPAAPPAPSGWGGPDRQPSNPMLWPWDADAPRTVETISLESPKTLPAPSRPLAQRFCPRLRRPQGSGSTSSAQSPVSPQPQGGGTCPPGRKPKRCRAAD